MDVICDRCSTEYEFDETLLSARGTSVKCTNCGHVFKVFPATASEGDPDASTWKLKRPDGTTDAIDSLRELQRRISAGELTPDDEIARGGSGWKKLGAIPELETFFHAAGAQLASPRIPSPIPPAPAGRKPVGRESSVPPARRPRQPTLMGVSPVYHGSPSGAATAASSPQPAPSSSWMPAPEPPPSEEPPSPAPESGPVPSQTELEPEPVSPPEAEPEPTEEPFAAFEPSEELSDPALDGPGSPEYRFEPEPDTLPETDLSTEWETPDPGLEWLRDSSDGIAEQEPGIADAEFEEAPHQLSRRSTPPPAYFEEDDDIPELPGRGWSPLSWLFLIVLVGGLALVATQWERVARLVGIGADPAAIAAGITEGDAGMALAHPAGYDAAIEAYGRALEAGADGDPELLAKLSRAYALAAESRADDGATAAEVASLEAMALAHARSAVALDPRNIEAKLAEADARRLAGDLAAARTALQEARAMSFRRSAEAHRIDALLVAAEGDGGLARGLSSARQAAELAPGEPLYLLLLARAELDAGNESRAREALESVLAEHPAHPVATKLLEELQAAAVPIDGVTETEAPTEGEAESTPESTELIEATTTTAAEETATQTGVGAETDSADTRAGEKPAEVESSPEETSASPTKAATPSATEDAAPTPTLKESAAPSPTRPKPVAKAPPYDEYDQLSKAAQDDAFVDGRPPVRDYEWYMSRGWDELAAGNHARARAFFDSALEVKPGSADAMDGLGRVSVAAEDYASALRYFRVAAQRGHPDGYYELGKTYERLRQKEEAVSAYYTYVVRNPDGKHVEAARRAIKALEPRAKLPPAPGDASPDQGAASSPPADESGSDLP